MVFELQFGQSQLEQQQPLQRVVRAWRSSILSNHLFNNVFEKNMKKLTKEELLFDLYIAYNKAKKHKSNKWYVERFSDNLDENIKKLRDDLWNRNYVPEPSTCFIIDHPKKREIYAASFRDRIVHHLYYDYTHDFFEKTFIHDSYSCIKNKGTNYGIKRLRHHILSESNNYTKETYVLKIDIKGYFMNIDKNILLKIAMKTIEKYKHKKQYYTTLDFEFIEYLTKEIILLDCTINSINISPKESYIGLPLSKMLASTPSHCGLPIGNLTSQLYSNVYLNVLDQFIKRVLKFKHYGRYVDDGFIVCRNKERLRQVIEKIERFLNNELHLELQKGKIHITNVKYGVEFLGAFIKPFRIYVSNQCLERIKRTWNIKETKWGNLISTISKLGYLSQYKTYNIRKNIFCNI